MNIIEKEGLIVIFRGVHIDKVVAVCEALYNGGVRVVEVAFNPSDKDTISVTTALMKKIQEAMGDRMYIGAGTVISTEYVVAAYNAGAKFIFSPNVNIDVIKLTKELGLVSIPGAFTPSEIMTAYDNGADMIKIFPVTVNEIGYIKNVTKPLSHIPFLCVGGVNENTIKDFFELGAKGVGTGISILKPELIEDEDYAGITRIAKLHIDKIKEMKRCMLN